MQFDNQSERFTRSRLPVIACILLLTLFAVLAGVAVSGKSPTFDEPLHALAGSVLLDKGDSHLDYENPPLWKYWAALPSILSPVRIDVRDPRWNNILNHKLDEYGLMIDTMYHRTGSDAVPDSLIGRGRLMMLLIGVALGVVTTWWSWRLAGPIAGVTACFLFSFDPNFIGHSALVKNDVVCALMFLAMAAAVCRLGKQITIKRVVLVGVLCGIGCGVKVSCVLLPLLACLLVLLRAVQAPWEFRHRQLISTGSRLVAALLIQVAIGLLTICTIWAAYGFRFSVSSDPSLHINTSKLVDIIRAFQTYPGVSPSVWKEPTTVRLALAGLKYQLLPEPWLNGLLYIYASTQLRPMFYLGERHIVSPWGYYPLAIIAKTPIATLAAGLIAGLAGLFALLTRNEQISPGRLQPSGRSVTAISRWELYCLTIPPLGYCLFAITSPSAGGLRHFLVIYPFAFMGIGIMVARLWKRRFFPALISVLALCLAAESLSAFPNEIAYFNWAAGGSRGGVHLLGDSNLDWGQDLPLLAEWQKANPSKRLYVSYFGTRRPGILRHQLY